MILTIFSKYDELEFVVDANDLTNRQIKGRVKRKYGNYFDYRPSTQTEIDTKEIERL